VAAERRGRAKAFGSGHLFTAIAVSDSHLLDLSEYGQVRDSFAYVRGVLAVLRGRPDADARIQWAPALREISFQTREILRPLYPWWDKFLQIRAPLDLKGRIANPYLDRVLGPAGG